jgi:hypothetical protein
MSDSALPEPCIPGQERADAEEGISWCTSCGACITQPRPKAPIATVTKDDPFGHEPLALAS